MLPSVILQTNWYICTRFATRFANITATTMPKLASQRRNLTLTCILVAVVITLVMLVVTIAGVVVRPTAIIRSGIWITPVIAVAIARVITIISRITVVCRVTEADSDSSAPD